MLFTDDSEIRQLNCNYRNKDKATDVLSFSQIEKLEPGDPTPKSLGDIVISVDTAQKQAEAIGHPFPSEINRLLVHGVLHLFGYDHEDVPDAEAKRMFELEEKILAELE